MSHRLAILFWLVLALPPLTLVWAEAQPDPPLVDPFRAWHDAEGNFLSNSRLAFCEEDQALLLQQSGQTLLIPQARLSATDRQWITEHPLTNLRGKVIYVADGDTIGLLDAEKKTHRIRLEGIDAPESRQAFGKKSRQALNRTVYGKEVLVTYEKTDSYGRILGQVYLPNADGQWKWINRQLIEDGWAWHYRHFSGDVDLAKTQQRAESAKAGLWRDAQPQPPWRFRLDEKRRKEAPQMERSGQKQQEDQPMTATGFWLNTSSGVRHNASCKHFAKTKRGKYCEPSDGKPCGICGG
ncbi:thermonuclease family protein [Blastopirellula marina]|uniref:TNase-like domain-containing protein n=1 Tax=Blastopirellula marina TaxID=124 RepID=A0A2S8GPG8_9BACT|nr:thermonuclease family protein [Blastopirellula marina]PQO46328.1 hypothetical protein C5Y93_10115 [Blastopirellula marina]